MHHIVEYVIIKQLNQPAKITFIIKYKPNRLNFSTMLTTENLNNLIFQAKEMNENLRRKVPVYKNLNDTATAIFEYSTQKAQNVKVYSVGVWKQTGQPYYKKGTKMVTNAQDVIQKKTDEILTKVETALAVPKQKNSKVLVKAPRQRIIGIFVRLNYLFLITTQNVKQYSSETIQKGKKMIFTYCLPIYITLKATVIVTKEMIFQLLQNRLQNMKITYEASKDTVTMIIAGKFNEEQIKSKISEGIKTFKDLKVKVVQKGLEIKVDGQSLRQNYQQFAIKFLDVVKSMKLKSAENIVSAKQRSINMYNEIINRIKEKEVEIRIASYQKVEK